MDNAVALVQAYLRVNGYFTVTEFPVVEAMRGGAYRTATDLDILAVRFPGAGHLVPASGRRGGADQEHTVTDAALGIPTEHGDMVVGEVKEGRAVLNAGAADPAVLRTVLVRFGCCSREEAPALVEALLRDGSALLPIGHRIRLVAFGSVTAGAAGQKYLAVSLGEIVEFLRRYLRDHWDVLRPAEYKDPALGFLVLLEKALAEAG